MWFVWFGSERREFEERTEAVAYTREMRAWYRAEGLTGRVRVGWRL